MSRLSSTSVRRAAPRLAAAPAVAGFRPKVAAVAVAAAFALQPQLAQAQPRGAQVIHGGATVTYSGANAVIRTSNGAGTRHSAIDWQSFSVPAGSITRFIQPSAASTSINRVVGDDPSAIYGTLRSNGNLVLVNPRGIAVGAGAVVDTNGFTASTLSMSDADAIGGRLVFQGAGGPLTVDGQVLARGGDVVLVGSRVQAGSGAVVQSEGATILAAGERVAVTGRGLEGIRMEVKAGNEAVNLGTLEGDAVGIFARTLRHSGHVAAVSSDTAGGRVLLKAIGGDNHVDGTVAARAGNRGGRIDVLGERIALEAGALLRASGHAGGGRVRVGGDYQGASAGAPNAKRVYMDAGARIEADATGQGKGGRVIVWSDEVTRMHGHISARGGARGGAGGFAEVSGKERLEFTGLADLRAPQGRMGTLLLDPEDILIVHEPAGTLPPSSTNTFPSTDPGYTGSMFEPSSANPVTLTDRHLNLQLASSNVRVKTSATIDNSGSGGQITMNSDAVITWSSGSSLMLEADKGMTLAGRIEATGTGGVYLKALGGDITQPTGGKIRTGNLVAEASGRVSLLGPNEIGTLAGTASGEFFVKNAQSLTVGTASTGHTTRTSITAGSVRLETTAAGADITVDETIQAASGGIVVDAKGSVKGDGVYRTAGGAGGTVYLHGRGGDVRFATIHTMGGGSGVAGGKVDVMAAQDVVGGDIDARGANGTTPGSDGGQGGNVLVKAGGVLAPASTLAPLTILANGGQGASGDSVPGGNAGAGGRGGTVTIEQSSGDLVLADVLVQAHGGRGGSTTHATGLAGAGGKGGNVVLKAPGKIIVEGATIEAVRGSGGSASSGAGADGLQGYLETKAPVRVDGWMSLDAIWNNTGTIEVGAEAQVYGDGMLRNSGTLALGADSQVDLWGGVENGGVLKVLAGSADASLTRNTGTVEVAAGTTLDTQGYFVSNAGTLDVNGTLLAGDELCVECEYLGGLATGPGLRNEAGGTIKGTGALIVSGGSGTLYNAGTIAPGGVGTTGRLLVDGNLVMESGSVLAVDLVNRLTHDILEVTGGAATGGTVEVNHPAGSSIAAGDTFAVVRAAMLETPAMPAVNQPHIVAAASGNDLVLRATAPVPAPASGPTTTQQQAQQQVAGQVVTFQQLFEQELDEQEDNGIGKDDIVVTDTACAPR